MKEFINKHPILSFLLGSAAIDGAVKIVKIVAYAVSGREGLADSLNPVHVDLRYHGNDEEDEEENEEETADEPAGDIQ